MLDEAVQVGRPRRVYLDVEAYLPGGMARFDRGRLLCASIVDDADAEVATVILRDDTDLGERLLLEELVAAIDPYDQVLAWNGDRFDFEFLRARAEACGFAVEWRRWLLLDHMELCRRMNVSASKSGEEKQSMALASWAAAVLKEEKKVDLSEGTHVAWRMWSAGGEERRRLAAYCRDDAGKMARIEEKTGFVELHQSICEAAGVLPSSRTIGPLQIVESFVMRLGRERGMRFPSFFGYEGGARRSDGTEARDGKLFEGAFVLKPTRLGIIEGVHVCDFSRLYPSIAQTWNLSPETLYKRAGDEAAVDGHRYSKGDPPPKGVCAVPGSGHWFRVEPRGLLPFVFDEMLRQRAVSDDRKKAATPGSEEWNEADKQSTAYKNMTNAAFGIMGSRWSRLFRVEVAESMTLCGQVLIQRVISEGEKEGIDTFAGDTDSSFAAGVLAHQYRSFVARMNRDVLPEIARSHGAAECRLSLAYEKAFDRVVYTSAKHYAGRIDHYKGTPAGEESQPEIKGLEFKRGDVSRLARAMQAEVLDLLLGGGVLEDPERGIGKKTLRRTACESRPDVFLKVVERWRDRIINRDLKLSEIIVSKRLSKEPEHYKRPRRKDGSLGAPPPQVRAAFMARERGRDVGAGVRVEYVVADAREKVLVLAEDYDGMNVDRAHLWENLVYPATMRVLQACFPAVKWEAWRRVRQHMGRPGQARLFEF
jgi:DNA polymerase elongation subunit (family B)